MKKLLPTYLSFSLKKNCFRFLLAIYWKKLCFGFQISLNYVVSFLIINLNNLVLVRFGSQSNIYKVFRNLSFLLLYYVSIF